MIHELGSVPSSKREGAPRSCTKWKAFIERGRGRRNGLPRGPLGVERAHVADDLIGTHQKFPDWLVKMTFLGKVETAVRLGMKPWFHDVGRAPHFRLVLFCFFCSW